MRERPGRGASGAVVAVVVAGLIGSSSARAAWVWVEGEKALRSSMHRHPYWYDQVKRDLFSGGDFTSNFSDTEPGEASYRVEAPQAGAYEFWVRANPVQARLSYALNGGTLTPIDLT